MPPAQNLAQQMRTEQENRAEQQAAHMNKVGAVMSMFNQVAAPQPVAAQDQPKGFVPAGALAAQQLNSNPYQMQPGMA